MRSDAKAITTSNGKTYIVHPPSAYRTTRNGIIVAYAYWSTRDGDYFGPVREATTADKGKIGRELVAAAQAAWNVDHDAMIAAVESREVTA
jgi:hypothetical protein